MKFQIELDDDVLREGKPGDVSVSVYPFNNKETQKVEIKIHPNGQVDVNSN